MKSKIKDLLILVICLSMLISALSACGGKKQTYGSSSSITDNTMTDYHSDSIGSFSIVNKEQQPLVEAQLLDKNLSAFNNPYITYSGSDLKYFLHLQNHTNKDKVIYIILFVGNEVQPFKIGGSTVTSYVYNLAANTSDKVELSFDPLIANDINDTPVAFEISVKDKNQFDLMVCQTGLNLKSSDLKFNKNEETTTNKIAKSYDFNFPKDKFVSAFSKPTNGNLTLGTAQSLLFTRSEPLCYDVSGFTDGDYRMFMAIDGKIVDAFDGKDYVDFTERSNTYNEIPIDKSVLNLGQHDIEVFTTDSQVYSNFGLVLTFS